MKLYYSKGACSLAPHILINELNLPCEFIAVNLADKKTVDGKDYLQINPKGAVPALQLDNGEVLTENVVIQQYLVDTFNAKNLLPAVGDFARYRTLEWLNFASTDLHKNFSPFYTKGVPAEVLEQIFKPILLRKLNFLNQHLANHNYVMGAMFTLPDAYIFVTLTWLKVIKMDVKNWPHLDRYFHEVRQRPSVEKAFLEEGLH
jgi:glutathione S-transferase